MYRVIVTETAIADVDRLSDWLQAHGASYGLELGAVLSDAADSLVDYPERTPMSRNRRYRELYVDFHANQYVIQYRVRERNIVIARVRHSLEDR